MVKFTNIIWDAPSLFVTVHHQCWISYGMQYFRRIFSSRVRWLLELVAELGGPGGFVPLLLTYIFSVGSDRCFRRFAVSMGRLFPLFGGFLGGW